MKGLPGGMQQFMKQYNQLQTKMQKLQEDLEGREYKSSSGGEAVTAVIKNKQVISLKITQEVLESKDAEMLQDLILTAVNDALKTALETQEKEMQKLTGGVSLPGMF